MFIFVLFLDVYFLGYFIINCLYSDFNLGVCFLGEFICNIWFEIREGFFEEVIVVVEFCRVKKNKLKEEVRAFKFKVMVFNRSDFYIIFCF